ncbi:helix-turn-helix transcriptional regulator [Halobacillus shinanisalinarum]|uniref:Helix-turn-helix transcriptional regulator n=1 Tax=Halobacillus shinanisalinarum TaxID=2932258 RepID=A0ABY4GUA9_9BACI|nr:helix-turn-helix domain-containing protein [Halobacillus shinanisalinarum]UOQ91733.1 helix-turn-helix transcriptional regulator [Halobacillus shinanisalinarum]
MEMRLDLVHTGFIHFDLQNGEADEVHTHDHFQLSVPLNGDLLTHHNEKPLLLAGHEGLLVPPLDSHQHEATNLRKEILLISVSEEILRRAYERETGLIIDDIAFYTKQPTSSGLLQEVKKMYQIAAQDGVTAAINLEEQFAHTFLDYTSGNHSERWREKAIPNIQGEMVKGVLDYIQAYYDKPLTLEQMALGLNVSKYHLHRCFSKETGQSPIDYLHLVRLEKAKVYLLSGQSITQTAFDIGYQSLSTFNRAFKKFNHCTPREYIKTAAREIKF